MNIKSAVISDQRKVKGLKVKTQVKAGGGHNDAVNNHNETLVSDRTKAKGLRIKSNIKAGRPTNGTINVGGG